MPTIIPPVIAPPQIDPESPRARIDFRVQQIAICLVTLGFTAWLWRIHPVLGIAAAFIAKHVLVAVLASGLRYPTVNVDDKIIEPTQEPPKTDEPHSS
jgi:hypothetical protein